MFNDFWLERVTTATKLKQWIRIVHISLTANLQFFIFLSAALHHLHIFKWSLIRFCPYLSRSTHTHPFVLVIFMIITSFLTFNSTHKKIRFLFAKMKINFDFYFWRMMLSFVFVQYLAFHSSAIVVEMKWKSICPL